MDTLPSGTVVVGNPARGLWDSASAWRVVEDLRIGSAEGDEATAFGRVAGVAADGSGRVYVLDRQAQDVRVFAPDGRHLRTIGRKGGGPGEFQTPVGLTVDSADRLWVVDVGARRYSVFDTAGTFESSFPRQALVQTSAVTWGFVAGGALWDSWPLFHPGDDGPGATAFFRLDSGEGYTDSLVLPPFEQPSYVAVARRGSSTMRYSFPIPFAPEEMTALDPRGFVWRGVSDAYRIAQLSFAGDSVRLVTREYQPIPVTAQDRERSLERLRQLATEMDLKVAAGRVPAFKPAIIAMLADDRGYLWVAPHAADDSAAIAFDVFDPEGRYLGPVPTPVTPQRLRPRPVVRGNALYYVTTGELDVPYVVRARIVGRK